MNPEAKIGTMPEGLTPVEEIAPIEAMPQAGVELTGVDQDGQRPLDRPMM